jgi:hypothetical protein
LACAGCSDFDIGDLAIPLFIDEDGSGQMDSDPTAHCADVLDSLVRNALGVHSRKHGNDAISQPELRNIMERKLARTNRLFAWAEWRVSWCFHVLFPFFFFFCPFFARCPVPSQGERGTFGLAIVNLSL